jgi:hypothetical protein
MSSPERKVPMKLWMLFLVSISVNAFAADSRIVGAWHLDEWQVIGASGARAEFCKGAKGVLLYESSGFVSTSINCPKKKSAAAEPADAYGRRFFYAGTYFVKNLVIYKDVTNASSEGLIGKRVVRYIDKLTPDELILTGPFGPNGGSLWIRWTR